VERTLKRDDKIPMQVVVNAKTMPYTPVKLTINKTQIENPKTLRYFPFILERALPRGLARRINAQTDMQAETITDPTKRTVCEK
jgi:hypothetical protein